jgi:hypothetical protein
MKQEIADKIQIYSMIVFTVFITLGRYSDTDCAFICQTGLDLFGVPIFVSGSVLAIATIMQTCFNFSSAKELFTFKAKSNTQILLILSYIQTIFFLMILYSIVKVL